MIKICKYCKYLKCFIENWINCLPFNAGFELGLLAGVREQVYLDVWIGGTTFPHSRQLDGTVDPNMKFVIFVLDTNKNLPSYFVISSGSPRY